MGITMGTGNVNDDDEETLQYADESDYEADTDADGRDFVIAAIRESGEDPAGWDVEGIVDRLREICGTYDFDKIDHDTFWGVIAQGQYDDENSQGAHRKA